MVYRRRYRRRRLSRRRFRKRRRPRKRKRRASFRKKVASLAKKAVFKAQSNVQRHISETRGITVSSTRDQVMWFSPAITIGDPSGFRQIAARLFDENADQKNDALETNVVGGGESLPDYQYNVDKKYGYFKYGGVFHMRNMSQHPIHMTFYCVKPKKHIYLISGTDTDIHEHAMGRLIQGWLRNQENTQLPGSLVDDDTLLGGSMSPQTSVTQLEQNGAAYGYYIETQSSLLWPSQSSPFNEHYKIEKKVNVKLMPGDDFYYKVKVPNFRYNDAQWHGLSQEDVEDTTALVSNDLSQAISGIKNVTKLFLVRIHGALGVGDTDALQSGYMKAHLACQWRESARCYEISQRPKRTYTTINTETTAALVGPSEHVQTVEGV